MSPEVAHRAKKLAHARKTSVSGLVEDLLRTAPMPQESKAPFVERWAGKFQVARAASSDARLDVLKAKYGLKNSK